MFLINPYILQASGNPLWNDLLAYYTADNTPNDALGTYNGTLTNGATYGTGIINNGFSLDGVDDYVDMGNVLDFDGSTPFSFNFWVYYVGTPGRKSLLKKQVTSTSAGYRIFSDSSRYLDFRLIGIGGSIRTRVLQTLPQSVWTMCTVTYDGSGLASGIKMYLDGSVKTLTVDTDTFSGSSSNSGSFNLGANIDLFLDGNMDEVGIWNRELTASEVTELYNSGAGLQY